MALLKKITLRGESWPRASTLWKALTFVVIIYLLCQTLVNQIEPNTQKLPEHPRDTRSIQSNHNIAESATPEYSMGTYDEERTRWKDVRSRQQLPETKCIPGTPCEYNDEIDLRIIVMAWNRSRSLDLCLQALQKIVLDGDKAVLEIWVDRDARGNRIHNATLEVALQYKWAHGPVRVTVQESHVGIYGQWIDTWRPRVNTREIAIFLEDDIDVSPYAYRWAKAVHAKYDHRPDVCGYSLSEVDIVDDHNYRFKVPADHIAFMFRRFGTFGFSPHPKVWRDFQDWFHYKQRYMPEFHPYIAADFAFTLWYEIFEKRETERGMWSLWFEYFTYYHGYFAVFPNIGQHLNRNGNMPWGNTTFAFHRREKGLHFLKESKRKPSEEFLLVKWTDKFYEFPDDIPKYNFTGKLIKVGENLVSPKNMSKGSNMENYVRLKRRTKSNRFGMFSMAWISEFHFIYFILLFLILGAFILWLFKKNYNITKV